MKGHEIEIVTHIKSVPIGRRLTTKLPRNEELKAFAKELRANSTLSEVIFWNSIKRRQFFGIDFDRQRIIGSYIVDFYVKDLGLVIEIDGDSHISKGEYDLRRLRYLKSLGLDIFSIRDEEVKQNLQQVLMNLADYIILNYGLGADGRWLKENAHPALEGDI